MRITFSLVGYFYAKELDHLIALARRFSMYAIKFAAGPWIFKRIVRMSYSHECENTFNFRTNFKTEMIRRKLKSLILSEGMHIICCILYV